MDADNQKIQAPFGDVYIPDTSATDKLSQQLNVQNTQNRKLQLAQQNLLDKEFSKELGLIKNADIPEFSKSYQDYATLSKSYSNQPGGATLEQQQQIMQAKQNAFSFANASIANKKRLEEYNQMSKTKEGRAVLSPDYETQSIKLLNTPTSQLGNDWETSLKYNGSNYNDGGKDIKDWMGTPSSKPVYGPEEKVDNNGIQTKLPKYTFASEKPILNVYNDMNSGMRKTKDATDRYNANAALIPDSEYIATDAAYQALSPQDKRFTLLGQTKPDLNISTAKNLIDKLAIHNAQQHALDNVPISQGYDLKTNDNNKMNADYAIWLKKQPTLLQNSFAKMDHASAIGLYSKMAQTNDKVANIDSFMQNQIDQGKKAYDNINTNTPSYLKTPELYPLSNTLLSAFAQKSDKTGKQITGDEIYYNPKDNTVIVKNGGKIEGEDLIMPYDLAKTKITKSLFPTASEQNVLPQTKYGNKITTTATTKVNGKSAAEIMREAKNKH